MATKVDIFYVFVSEGAVSDVANRLQPRISGTEVRVKKAGYPGYITDLTVNRNSTVYLRHEILI